MASRLQDSHATLEGKVAERTKQLELANQAKSRFLATASHDLRQPLHALGLFVAQLNTRNRPQERTRIVDSINASIASMNDLFNALLDISKLDAGAMTTNLTQFPIANVLKILESTFIESAREKDISLKVAMTDAWVRSDAILLERILLNLVSNAVRYTSVGGVMIGCRKRGGHLRIEVWDTGPGIPEDQRQNVFGEFYRLAGSDNHDRCGGLGWGLAIVDRLCRLLDQRVELTSRVGKGSRFAILVPIGVAQASLPNPGTKLRDTFDVSIAKLVVVIDDDYRALDGMGGLLRSWGCRVVTASSADAAVSELAKHDQTPDLIISDYQLPSGKTGIDAIARLRSGFSDLIPAFLISGDTNPELLHQARVKGLHLLHKPVDPMTLRAMVNRMMRNDGGLRGSPKVIDRAAFPEDGSIAKRSARLQSVQ